MLVVSPAYGRDYTRKADVVADWERGKDFVNETQHLTGGGTYINQADCRGNCDTVQIRYKNKTKFVIVTVQG